MSFVQHKLGLAFRAAVLFALLASPNFASQVAAAPNPGGQSIPSQLPIGAPRTAPVSIAPLAPQGPPSAAVLKHLGIQRPAAQDLTALSQQVAQEVRAHGLPAAPKGPQMPTIAGLLNNINLYDTQSTSLMTTLDSSGDANFRDVGLFADADGREDNLAEHSAKLDDLTTANLPAGWTLTRVAASEHTSANGFNENVFYYGDSVGNVYVAVKPPAGTITYTVINLPTVLNAFGSLSSDSQIVVTGLGVNPVADLSSFPKVNGSFAPFDGKIGEILYVEFWDTNGGFRAFNNGQNIQSGVLAFPIADITSPAAAPPGVLSQSGFPIMVGGSFGVAFSTFANVAGLAVDDDGSVYFQQVDLTNFTGGNIVKIASTDNPGNGPQAWQDRSLATNGFLTTNTLDPINGLYGTSAGPFPQQLSTLTNFAGTSTTWGNIAALSAGPGNILYAALSRSLVPTDSAAAQATEGLFTNPTDLGATPSMVISFADTAGSFAACSVPVPGTVGTLPVPDGFADVAQSGLTLEPGVNNFRIFALGNGPDVRGHVPGATVANTLKIDFQVDDTLYSGLAADNESKVYVISGATPAGIGLNPSPSRTEILAFPDQQPFDRRADFIDQRPDGVPSPFLANYNSLTPPGDGLVDRFDYIYLEAPLDQASLTPVGMSGLAGGFLLYLNRTRTDLSRFTTLPNGQTQADDATSGPVYFEDFDGGVSSSNGHQIAGGDDQQFPFRGDDSDGGGLPAIAGPLQGGFEFNYRAYTTTTHSLVPTAWNAFYLNSNGSLSFGTGDASPTPTVASMLQGAPRLAGAWTNLDPGSAWQRAFTSTFPVQALGFANINHFVVRWINVPSAGFESCNSSNTFSIGLHDDGTGLDENANQPLNPANPIGNNAVPFNLLEGPTDQHYVQSPNTLMPAGYSPRPDFSGNLCYTYGRMDLLGSQAVHDQVLVGAAPGLLPISTTPGLNLSQVARANDKPFPAQLGVSIGINQPSSPYQFFSTGTPNTYTTMIIVTTTVTTTVPGNPVFDLRQEGNDPALGTPVNQPDQNRGQVCFYNLANQTITFGPLANQSLVTSPFTVTAPLTATASSGLPVTFISLTPTICTVSGSQMILLLSGQCIIRAQQLGNDLYEPSLAIDRAFEVTIPLYLPAVRG